MTIRLEDDDLAVLNHVVIDGRMWLQKAVVALGEEEARIALTAKVEKYRAEYEAAKATQGAKYRCRKDRDIAGYRSLLDNPKADEAQRSFARQMIVHLENGTEPVRLSTLRAQRRVNGA